MQTEQCWNSSNAMYLHLSMVNCLRSRLLYLQVDLPYTCDGLVVRLYALFKSKYVTQSCTVYSWSITDTWFRTKGSDLQSLHSIVILVCDINTTTRHFNFYWNATHY